MTTETTTWTAAGARLREEAGRPHGPLVQLGVSVPKKKQAETMGAA